MDILYIREFLKKKIKSKGLVWDCMAGISIFSPFYFSYFSLFFFSADVHGAVTACSGLLYSICMCIVETASSTLFIDEASFA